jgi:two-component system, OmpR family, alkaline phosphatase synthesis response regulator PhoP
MSDGAARILIVEDERHLADGIRENLEVDGHQVEVAYDGKRGLELARNALFDLIVLDVMLPEIDGFTVCEMLREDENDTPVLFLTARGAPDDRIRGLEAGGDDYLSKPFHLRELLLRIEALLRRRNWYTQALARQARLDFGGNSVDFRSYQARGWDGRDHTLSQRETMILKALAERAGEVVSREEILETVWGYDVYPSTRTIDNFIVRLRRRFEPNPEEPQYLHTVRGIGYRLTVDANPRAREASREGSQS